jgi:hypothetical protein
MKKALTVVLEDRDIIELMRILMDSGADGSEVGPLAEDEIPSLAETDAP